MLQLGFEAMVPAVQDKGIDGTGIAVCYDSEDFSELFPLVTPPKANECYLAVMAYQKKNRKKKQQKKRAAADSATQVR